MRSDGETASPARVCRAHPDVPGAGTTQGSTRARVDRVGDVTIPPAPPDHRDHAVAMQPDFSRPPRYRASRNPNPPPEDDTGLRETWAPSAVEPGACSSPRDPRQMSAQTRVHLLRASRTRGHRRGSRPADLVPQIHLVAGYCVDHPGSTSTCAAGSARSRSGCASQDSSQVVEKWGLSKRWCGRSGGSDSGGIWAGESERPI